MSPDHVAVTHSGRDLVWLVRVRDAQGNDLREPARVHIKGEAVMAAGRLRDGDPALRALPVYVYSLTGERQRTILPW